VCPRYKYNEDWEHVLLCNGIDHLKNKYMDKLNISLMKLSNNENDQELVETIIVDIRNYLY